jgi:hypothetical protein
VTTPAETSRPVLTCDACDREIMQVLRTRQLGADLHAILCPGCYLEHQPTGQWDRFEWVCSGPHTGEWWQTVDCHH